MRVDGVQKYQFFAVFDGHGGIDAATFCKSKLMHNLMDGPIIETGQLGLALQQAIIDTDQQYCDIPDQKGSVGTTAACLLVDL